MSTLESTRLSLHIVAELLLAGPQFEISKSIELRAVPGGFGTTKEPDLKVVGTDLVDLDRTDALAFEVGDQALQAFSPGVHSVLWPEHFDIGITVGEVNYGISPGDSFLGVPYAYVGPWQPGAFTGSFRNAPFGAARPMSGLADADAVLEFLREGERLAG